MQQLHTYLHNIVVVVVVLLLFVVALPVVVHVCCCPACCCWQLLLPACCLLLFPSLLCPACCCPACCCLLLFPSLMWLMGLTLSSLPTFSGWVKMWSQWPRLKSALTKGHWRISSKWGEMVCQCGYVLVVFPCSHFMWPYLPLWQVKSTCEASLIKLVVQVGQRATSKLSSLLDSGLITAS